MLSNGGELSWPYVIIGAAMMAFAVWLIREPRNSKVVVFLGPMLRFRLFGILLLILGLFTFLVGLGLRSLGAIPITVN